MTSTKKVLSLILLSVIAMGSLEAKRKFKAGKIRKKAVKTVPASTVKKAPIKKATPRKANSSVSSNRKTQTIVPRIVQSQVPVNFIRPTPVKQVEQEPLQSPQVDAAVNKKTTLELITINPPVVSKPPKSNIPVLSHTPKSPVVVKAKPAVALKPRKPHVSTIGPVVTPVKRKAPQGGNYISQADFLDAQGMPTKTRKLFKPGIYRVTEDITFAPTQEYAAAIEIVADNVTLNLDGHGITQLNTTSGAVGVRIGKALDYLNPAKNVYKNITVKDGGILNFTGSAISAINTAQFYGKGAFESLTFKDIAIIDCGSNPSYAFASGIDLDSFARLGYQIKPSDIAYRDVLIDGCFIKRCKGTAAINVYPGVNVRVVDTDADEPLAHPRRGV